MIILIATQRSGTNMLRKVLAGHPNLWSLPEVFNNVYSAKRALPHGIEFYEEYFLDRIRQNPESALPDNRSSVVSDYLAGIDEILKQQGCRGILDVKYNSLHHADGAWLTPGSLPEFFRIIKSKNYKVIHLTRKDQLATVYSRFRARAAGRYNFSLKETVAPVRFAIPPATFRRVLTSLERTQAVVSDWIDSSGVRKIEITYEDLFMRGPGSDFDKSRFYKLLDFLELDHENFVPEAKTLKVSPRNFREELDNFDELERFFRDTPWHEDFVRKD